MQIVWLKRDIRITDHLPLYRASLAGKMRVIYIFEPSLWDTPELDYTHFDFICQSLLELEQNFKKLGGGLMVCVAEIPQQFDQWHTQSPIAAIHSHQETGTGLTYDRDRRVAAWAKKKGIQWYQYRQHGVCRPAISRDDWGQQWNRFISDPLTPTIERADWFDPPQEVPLEKRLAEIAEIVLPEDFGKTWIFNWNNSTYSSHRAKRQPGGESQGQALLGAFLQNRGIDYRWQMSSPLTASTACSRLSPHLAWGTLSVKQAFQQTQDKVTSIRQSGGDSKTAENQKWLKSLSSFTSRLAWRCHFIQKLEDEPELEFKNLCNVYDGLRENEFCEKKFAAWKNGQTGFPMIDACMRALHENRWINFRMRAMLVSFASYQLWLHWRPTAQHLARLFLDFEPGIHFPQVQMQSGMTGINTIRIYSPIKQALDQDPSGSFIRQYVPELADVPIQYLAEPHKMPILLQREYGCVIDTDYPGPIVDHATAYRLARDRIHAVRRTQEAKSAAEQVYQKHGSRKRGVQSYSSNKRSSKTKSDLSDSTDRQGRLFD